MSEKYNKTNSDALKKKMIAALEKTLGVVTTACKVVGIARQTHYRWLEEDEKYKKDTNEISEVAIDFAESALHKQIRDENTSATIFYLKTKGKMRGYIEAQEFKIDLDKKLPQWLEEE